MLVVRCSASLHFHRKYWIPGPASISGICSTITTTIANRVNYIPVPCIDTAHADTWSEEVLVDGTTAELIIAPSGDVHFVSETWLDASLPTSASSNSRTLFSTKPSAGLTSSGPSTNHVSSYASQSSSAGPTTSLEKASSKIVTSAIQASSNTSNPNSGTITGSISIGTASSYRYISLGAGTNRTSLRT